MAQMLDFAEEDMDFLPPGAYPEPAIALVRPDEVGNLEEDREAPLPIQMLAVVPEDLDVVQPLPRVNVALAGQRNGYAAAVRRQGLGPRLPHPPPMRGQRQDAAVPAQRNRRPDNAGQIRPLRPLPLQIQRPPPASRRQRSTVVWCHNHTHVQYLHSCTGHASRAHNTCQEEFKWLPHQCSGHKSYTIAQAEQGLTRARRRLLELLDAGRPVLAVGGHRPIRQLIRDRHNGILDLEIDRLLYGENADVENVSP